MAELVTRLDASGKSVSALQTELARLGSSGHGGGETAQALRDSQRQLLSELAAVQAALAKQGEQLAGAFGAAKTPTERKQLTSLEDVVESLKEQQEALAAGLRDQVAKLSGELKAQLASELKQATGELSKGFSQFAKELKSSQSASAKELVSVLLAVSCLF
jgi:hypothetical protein